MLTLTRRVGESIVLQVSGKSIEITLHTIQGKQARLRFLADNDVKIIRKELLDKE